MYIDVDQVIKSIREDAEKARMEKERLYKPLSPENLKYLYTDFFPNGRMVSGTKNVDYWKECVFNANICTKSHGKIWYGDLRLTTDQTQLQELANKLGESIYILREHDARFSNEVKPLFDHAVISYEPIEQSKFFEIKWDTQETESEKMFISEAEARTFASRLCIDDNITKIYLCNSSGETVEKLKG